MTNTIPEALAIYKRGRWCVVAKITTLIGETDPVLAVVWRNQVGTSGAISMPQVVLDYVKKLGVKNFVLRDDRKLTMHKCPLSLFDKGRLHTDGERYIPLNWLESTAWRNWRYAKVVRKIYEPTKAKANSTQLRLIPE